MKRLAVTAFLLLAACSTQLGEPIVVVTVTATPALTNIQLLHVTGNIGTHSAQFDVHSANGGPVGDLPPSFTFVVKVPTGLGDQLKLHVEARDRAGLTMAVGDGTAPVKVAMRTDTDSPIVLVASAAMTGDLAMITPVDMMVNADLSPVTCNAGFHVCNGQCVDGNSINSCGTTSCAVCPVGASAVNATCDGTSCGLKCINGYHVCNGACVSNSDPNSCNLSCTPCTAPSGGTATCDGTQCGGACPANQKLCFGACIPSGQACNGVCANGTHNCSDNCLSDTSENSCGGSCSPCPVPTNATAATCGKGGMCDFTCDANYMKCGLLCIPKTGCCGDGDCSTGLTCQSHACACPGSTQYCTNACFDLTSTTDHCGDCNIACTFPHAGATCVQKSCVIGSCQQGYQHCTNNPADGCETYVMGNDNNNCGGCNLKCKVGQLCNVGMCKENQVTCNSPGITCKQPSCYQAGRYSISAGGGIVVDLNNGRLLWQRATQGPSIHVDAVDYCLALVLEGINGWHLSTSAELATTLYMTSGHQGCPICDPGVDQAAFNDTPSYSGTAVYQTNTFNTSRSVWYEADYCYGGGPGGSKPTELFRCVHDALP